MKNKYQYLSKNDLDIIQETINRTHFYVRDLQSIKYNKLYPGLWDRIQQEFSLLINCENCDIKTKLYLVIKGLKERPKCPICGKHMENINTMNIGFSKSCRGKCTQFLPEVRRKNEETSMRNHGVKNGGGSKQSIEKAKQTNMKNRGVECSWQDPIVIEKIKATKKKKYGIENYVNPEKARQTSFERYNVSNGGASKQAWEKIKETRRKNGNISRDELKYYEIFVSKYGKENVLTQYKSEDYPFYCDFYIVSEKLYIEIQGYPSHGNHPFNPENPEDLKLVEEWRRKANGNPKSRYASFIKGWTIKDPLKREIAKLNNLNYLEIWP